jgi:predicted AlkP superfamily pyrophosphatase or phosphodiesterase
MKIRPCLVAGMMLIQVSSVTSAFAEVRPPRPAVLLVSIDGLRADDVAGADKLGLKIPNLRRLMAGGTTARRMIPVFPSVTYPAHTSLVTGCTPGRHGILSNDVFAPLVDAKPDWYWYAKGIKVSTLYDAARTDLRATAAVGWPVTVGAKIDYNVPEYWDAKDFDGTFVAKVREVSTPGLIDAVEKQGPLPFDLKHIDEAKNRIACFIVREHRPDLLLLHYSELDKKQHLQGPGTPDVLATIEKTDRLLGELLDAYRQADISGRLITCVVSDHGFERVDREFKPNVVLRQAGLIDCDADTNTIKTWRAKGWVSGGSAAIVPADKMDAESIRKARTAMEAYTGKPDSPIRRIIDADELRRLDANPQAAFAIDPAPGVTLGRSVQGEVLAPAFVKGMHGQMPDRPEIAAIFFVVGPGIPRGEHLDTVRMIDVAPTLARLADLNLPDAQGKPIALPARAGIGQR